jgi:hypothetical protein
VFPSILPKGNKKEEPINENKSNEVFDTGSCSGAAALRLR